MSRTDFLKFNITSVIIAAILGGMVGVGWSVFIPVNKSLTTTSQKPEDLSNKFFVPEESVVTDIVEKQSAAVVSISSQKIEVDNNKIKREVGTSGSGFIISSDGIIVTSAHVVDDPAARYFVITRDEKIYQVERIKSSKKDDIAVLKISAKDLPTARFGDSSTLKPGQSIIAIGTILGRFENSVSVGVISAIGRQITATDPTGYSEEKLSDVVQVDIAVNPGSSGGPVFNSQGEVIGVITAYTEGAENLGFAIPSNTAEKIVSEF